MFCAPRPVQLRFAYCVDFGRWALPLKGDVDMVNYYELLWSRSGTVLPARINPRRMWLSILFVLACTCHMRVPYAPTRDTPVVCPCESPTKNARISLAMHVLKMGFVVPEKAGEITR
eukprot:2282785-Rhodomonas_salina.3